MDLAHADEAIETQQDQYALVLGFISTSVLILPAAWLRLYPKKNDTIRNTIRIAEGNDYGRNQGDARAD